MNNEFFIKTTNYKLFGKTLFSKEEIFSGCEYQGQIYQIQVNQDYYNSEFDLNKDEKKKK